MTKEETRDRGALARPGAAVRGHGPRSILGRLLPGSGEGLAPLLRSSRPLSLFAVGAVVVLVTLPRLRAFALAENEGDARALLRMIGAANVVQAAEGASDAPARRIADLPLEGRALTAGARGAQSLRGGELLRLHGYLFDLAPGERCGSGDSGQVLRAWPYQHGRTGHGALVLLADGTLRSHDNTGGRWSGEDHPPRGPFDEAAGWRALPTDADWR
jgi:hypothetical protein